MVDADGVVPIDGDSLGDGDSPGDGDELETVAGFRHCGTNGEQEEAHVLKTVSESFDAVTPSLAP